MTLLALQQDFRTWLTTEPSELPPRLAERMRPGLVVYLNNYRAQLVACLTESFPVVRAWIGAARFEGSAAHHIDRVPPHEWTLDAYGSDFPDTLAQLYPSEPGIAELASLERELARAFVRAGAEPPDPGTLAHVDWDAAVIQLTPAFMMLRVSTNAAEIWSAITAGKAPPSATCLETPAALAIWRDHFAPKFRTLSAEEASALAQMQSGETFGRLCTGLVARLGEEQGAAVAGTFLSQWLSDGMVGRITCGPVICRAPLEEPVGLASNGRNGPGA